MTLIAPSLISAIEKCWTGKSATGCYCSDTLQQKLHSNRSVSTYSDSVEKFLWGICSLSPYLYPSLFFLQLHLQISLPLPSQDKSAGMLQKHLHFPLPNSQSKSHVKQQNLDTSKWRKCHVLNLIINFGPLATEALVHSTGNLCKLMKSPQFAPDIFG